MGLYHVDRLQILVFVYASQDVMCCCVHAVFICTFKGYHV